VLSRNLTRHILRTTLALQIGNSRHCRAEDANGRNEASVRDQVRRRHEQGGEVPDVLGLQLKFESLGWSEFVTGETTLALHPASDKNPAGKVELGFTVADVEAFYRDMSAKGVLFSMPPKKQDFGGVLAQFVDSEGAHCSVGAEAA